MSFGRSPYTRCSFGRVYLKPAPPSPGGNGYRGVVVVNGTLREVTDAEIGTGFRPVVLLDGQLRTRLKVFDAGVPVVMVNGVLHTLPEGENLRI